jgi:hypothetical protein
MSLGKNPHYPSTALPYGEQWLIKYRLENSVRASIPKFPIFKHRLIIEIIVKKMTN